ncbi:MAG TPA: hypothetical protein VLG47_04275 [Candidatus Saccharimonadales bacterium]|nr:hypothetical protein [Candidatus Saccharimonadales bacterium]
MARKTNGKSKVRRVRLPHIMLAAFALVAIALVPWSLWLSYSLPIDHMDHRWNLVWSVFDIAMLASVAMTAYLGYKKSGWVVVAASISGTLLLVDAWFDCVTAMGAWEHFISVTAAAFVEIPLGLLAYWIAYRAGKQYFH